MKAFDVEFIITSPEGTESREQEQSVKNDRLRIPSLEKGESFQLFNNNPYVLPPIPVPVPKPVIQETTGIFARPF
jgi:hypothetical protein